ncbi:MAG: HDOD domain-containing protein [Spirochaetes bacterium]|nr:HDOD domain-containing protein [Spirochaetota bacterium]
MKPIKDPTFLIFPDDFMEAIDSKRDLYIQFYYLTSQAEIALLKIIHAYLQKIDAMYLKEMFVTITKELINNAVKANLKRVYFNERQLDITNPAHYEEGMKRFKAASFEEEKTQFDNLIKNRLIVRVSFVFKDDRLVLHVINNSPILPQELAKIQNKIEKAYSYIDISEAFDETLDDSEGAGLGLIMSMMLFKNAGFPKENFRITKKDNLTIATIILQPISKNEKNVIPIADEIAKEIETLPGFPSNIKEIQALCANPDAKIKDISDRIKRDPGLTTNILKIANSAGYMTINRVSTIEEAVMRIGLKGLNALLIASGVKNVMESKYKKFETIWKDSYKAAFYCQRLAIKYRKQNLLEFAYLAALLSSIGKLVIITIKPQLSEKLKELAGRKGIPDSGILEEIGLGISHSTLGAMILKKWKFTDELVRTIEFHTRPHMVPFPYRESTYLVYLANAFVDIEHNRLRYELLDDDVIEFFSLAQRDELVALHEMLKRAYDVHMQELK